MNLGIGWPGQTKLHFLASNKGVISRPSVMHLFSKSSLLLSALLSTYLRSLSPSHSQWFTKGKCPGMGGDLSHTQIKPIYFTRCQSIHFKCHTVTHNACTEMHFFSFLMRHKAEMLSCLSSFTHAASLYQQQP